MQRPTVLLCAFLLLLAGPAAGASIDMAGSSLNGSNVTDLGSAGRLSFEIDLSLPGTVDLAITLAPGEGPLAFDLLAFNFLSFDLGGVMLSLSGGAVFATLGDASSGSGGAAGVSGGGAEANVTFTPAEPTVFSLGNALGTGSADWVIDVSAVSSGRFGLALSVPEAAGLRAIATLCALLATGGAGARRRHLSASRGA